jgi:hypothetical protein
MRTSHSCLVYSNQHSCEGECVKAAAAAVKWSSCYSYNTKSASHIAGKQQCIQWKDAFRNKAAVAT